MTVFDEAAFMAGVLNRNRFYQRHGSSPWSVYDDEWRQFTGRTHAEAVCKRAAYGQLRPNVIGRGLYEGRFFARACLGRRPTANTVAPPT